MTDKKLSYNDVIELIQRITTGLYNLGLRQHDVLAACMTNCIEYLPLSLAVTSLGAIFTTTNPVYTEGKLRI